MDQYHGQGGTYMLNPETGERVLLERTEAPAPEVVPPPEPVPSVQNTRRRARTERGRFRGDDLNTPEVDEAWQ